MLKLSALVLLLAVLTSCNNNERTTESGLTYKVLREGTGEVAQEGEYLALNMKYGEVDSTWIDTTIENLPAVIMVRKTTIKAEPSLQDILFDLKLGDSVQFDVTAGDLYQKTWRRPLPPSLDSTSVVSFSVGVEAIMDQNTMRQWEMNQQQKITQNQLNYDISVIEKYLAENRISASKTESGLYYVITEESDGTKPQIGQQVEVNYVGYNLKGQYFDTSYKELAEEKGIYSAQREPYEPIEFVLGQRKVISGWEEGIALLGVGSKAKLIIPSTLAYGPRARGEAIGPNEILIFDIELVGVN